MINNPNQGFHSLHNKPRPCSQHYAHSHIHSYHSPGQLFAWPQQHLGNGALNDMDVDAENDFAPAERLLPPNYHDAMISDDLNWEQNNVAEKRFVCNLAKIQQR